MTSKAKGLGVEAMVKGVKVFIPAIEDMDFFYWFVDMCVDYGYDTIMMEIGGAMEYKRHPEINEAWTRYCKKFTDYQGQSLDYQDSFTMAKDSIHCENGGGTWVKQEILKDIVAYCKEKGIELIPEQPTLSHCDYLLQAYPALAEFHDEQPDTYCPQNEKVYEIVFDLMEEIIEVFQPKMINIGHDEYYTVGLCNQCRGKAPEDLYANDIIRIYDYLKNRGIKTMIWGEKLLNAYSKTGKDWGGAHRKIYNRKGEFLHEVPAIYPAIDKIPTDIVILHWYYYVRQHFEQELLDHGFPVIYGNYNPEGMYQFQERMAKGIGGFFISNWSKLNREHMQRNGIFAHMAYGAKMCEPDYDENRFGDNFIEVTDRLYQYFNKETLEGNYIEIMHNTNVFYDHHSFVDGYTIDKEKDYLGSYHIHFEDGSENSVPLFYGLNIGNENCNFERDMDQEFDVLNLAPQLLEPSATCRYHYDGEKMWYIICIGTEKEVNHVTFEAAAGKEGAVDFQVL